MAIIVHLHPPEEQKFGFKPMQFTKNEEVILEKWNSDRHAVNDLVQALIVQSTRKQGVLNISAYEQLAEAAGQILASNRERKTSPINVVLELREAFEKITGSSAI